MLHPHVGKSGPKRPEAPWHGPSQKEQRNASLCVFINDVYSPFYNLLSMQYSLVFGPQLSKAPLVVPLGEACGERGEEQLESLVWRV